MLYEILHPIFSLIVAFFILVSIHEFGHYIVARWCGVHVIRFSVGFGPVLFGRSDRHGTEFALSAIPLGGYVKMLDNREYQVPAAMQQYEYNGKSPWQRIAIAAAGPAANLLTAVLIYWLVHLIGTPQLPLYTGQIVDGSPAQEAGLQPGLKIVAVDRHPTESPRELVLQMVSRIGESGTLIVTTEEPSGNTTRDHVFILDRWLENETGPDPLASLGFNLSVPAIIGNPVTGSPAAAAGLRAFDRIVAVNDEPVIGWHDWTNRIRTAPGETLILTVARDGTTVLNSLTPEARTARNGDTIGYAGVSYAPPERVSAGPIGSLAKGFGETLAITGLTFELLGKMITGQLSPTNLSGPITIAKVASESASSGWMTFLRFLALISISLAVINLLPIPILDGGHILFYIAEIIMGKPVPQRIQLAGIKIGIILIGTLMFYVLYNDILNW